MRYEEIDWNSLWQEARARKSWQKKKDRDWDRRAPGFASRNLDSPYAAQFLEKIPLDPAWRVLDMGCGPGTLALPLAARVREVTAVDFSAAMLAQLQDRAQAAGLTNIRTIRAAWEDDWERLGIPPHDVAIASRSLSVEDLAGALAKLNRWGTKAVFVSDGVGAGPFDPELFAALGRPFAAGPDYIYTLNLLYSMGIHARVDFITLTAAKSYGSPEAAFESCAWMVDDLTASETARLQEYVTGRLRRTSGGRWKLARRHPAKWALIWWQQEE